MIEDYLADTLKKLEAKLTAKFGNRIEKRLPPAFTVSRVPGQLNVYAVHLDITLLADKDAEKAQRIDVWDDKPWVQFWTAHFAFERKELLEAAKDPAAFARLVEARLDAAIEKLRTTTLYEVFEDPK